MPIVARLPVRASRRPKTGRKTLAVGWDFHTVYVDRCQRFKVGPPPLEQPKSARRLRTRVRKGEVVNAVKVARKYEKFLARPDVLGYRDAAKKFGVSKTVVSVNLAVVTRLPQPFVDWLENCKDKLVIAFFTERRMRSVVRTEDETEKVAGLLGLIDECERQLEEENKQLNLARKMLAALDQDQSEPDSSSPKPREHRSIQLD